MGERKKEAALSLNDRHNLRLLQDLSASHPSSLLPPPAEEVKKVSKVKIQGRRRLCKASSSSRDLDYEDDIPHFSGIADFDSPPAETKPSKIDLEGSSLFTSYTDDDDHHDDDMDKDKDKDKDNPQMLQQSKFSTITDFHHRPLGNAEEETSKVKIEDIFLSNYGIDGQTGAASVNLTTSSGTTDHLNSRPEDKPSKVKIEGRRRLCKVSSKDDSTDIESKRRTVDDDPKFSRVSEFDTPPPPQAKNALESGNAGGNEIRDILNDLTSRLEFLSIEKNRIPKTVDLKRDTSVIVANDIYKQPKKEEDMPEYASASSSFSDTSYPSDSSLDATNQSRIGGGVEIKVDGPEEEIYLQSESEGDNCISTVNKIKNTGKDHKMIKTKRVGGTANCLSMGQPLSSKFEGREEDDDDDDCVVLSGKKMIKEVERQHGKFEQKFDDCYEVDALDEYTDESVSEDDYSITLSSGKTTYRLPGKIGKMLYPHQRDGLKWLWSLHCQGKGGILGDDMGLGKTMQICGFLAGLFDSSLIKRALIVAPKTLLPHWIKELSAVGLSAKTREYFGTSAKARQYELQYILQDKGVLLTTYDIVRNNAKSLSGDYYGERSEDGSTWDYMILDEGHLIKNPGTQRAKSLLEIPCTHRIVISGTPIQNNLKELWALFNFCCPELLGDKNSFKEKYESAIIRGSDKNASDREKRIGSTVAKELRERIQPCFLRRLKSEVFREDDATNTAKLSKKDEVIVWLRLTNCQRQLYQAFLNSELVLSAFDGSPLAALTILKKICDHPLLLTKRAAEDLLDGLDSMLSQEDHGVAEKLAKHIADVSERYDFKEKHDDVSCKISFIQSLLDKLLSEGHNVLIFSQTRKMLNLIQDSLISRGYKFLRIDGTTKASDRVKVVNDFQEGVAPIFLLTSQVGGLGLTLTKADRVIVVDPAWNPSTDNQSVDRAYRIGQKKDVLVYRLMTCGTIEEKIYRKQIFKGGLFKTATEHKEQTRYFSQQDLRELFSLPKHGFDVSPTQQQLHEEHDHQHTMDETLQAHIKFLETLGIAGVSHHSLLFSKTAPVPVVMDEEEVKRVKGSVTFMGHTSSISSVENNGDGVEFAFNPKDVKLNRKSYSPETSGKPTEREIKERIDRLSQIFANKATVTKLPDKGARIQKQIDELNLELNKIRVANLVEKEVIHIDDISGELQRVLNV